PPGKDLTVSLRTLSEKSAPKQDLTPSVVPTKWEEFVVQQLSEWDEMAKKVAAQQA
ncbi:Unknown protein, partial [Striga hermonthica]